MTPFRTVLPTSRTRAWAALALLAALSLIASACGSGAASTDQASEPAAEGPAGELTVAEVWSRRPAPGQTSAAVYAAISNSTTEARQLVAVSSSASPLVELHETVIDDEGVATMEERDDGFTIGAGGAMLLEPGGAHVMLRDIDPADFGSSIDLVFEFDDGESIAVTAEVRNDGIVEDHSDHDDHGADTDHDDHGADTDHDDHEDHGADSDHENHGAEGEILDIDVGPLHQVDDELAAGTLDVITQREVVADYLSELAALEPAPDSRTAELVQLLEDLDLALEAEDVAAAASLAADAHELAHALVPHS